MRAWAYPAIVERVGDDDFVVAFPDIPQIVTGGGSPAEALVNAEDALDEALLDFLARGEAPPAPRPAGTGEVAVPLDPVTASRVVLANAMRERKVSNVELAVRLGKSEGAVRRLTDGSSNVKIGTVLEAVRLLGGRAILCDEAS